MQCASEGSKRVALINRTLDKVAALRDEIAGEFPDCAVEVAGLELDALEAQLSQSDLVINCTALGMTPGDPSPLPAGRCSEPINWCSIRFTPLRGRR